MVVHGFMFAKQHNMGNFGKQRNRSDYSATISRHPIHVDADLSWLLSLLDS